MPSINFQSFLKPNLNSTMVFHYKDWSLVPKSPTGPNNVGVYTKKNKKHLHTIINLSKTIISRLPHLAARNNNI